MLEIRAVEAQVDPCDQPGPSMGFLFEAIAARAVRAAKRKTRKMMDLFA